VPRIWAGTVTDQHVPYVRPQENGNREDVSWVELKDANGIGLGISAPDRPFSFSALHFAASDLSSARHNWELKPRREVILSVNARQSGLGNSSCGPGVLEQYAVRSDSLALKLIIPRTVHGHDEQRHANQCNAIQTSRVYLEGDYFV
jgi:beta-galactosidase